MNRPGNSWHSQPTENGQPVNSIENQLLHPPHRYWYRTAYGKTYRYDRYGHAFVLMSYNILAQTLLTRHSYLYAENREEFLEWSHRLKCIRNEIFEIKPAILCLQEVQESHLDEIERALQPMGYTKPLYKKRTSLDYDDGCAIFYNSKQFELIDYHYVEYYQPEIKVSFAFSPSKMFERCFNV